jgi:glycosyltransferase involved in cell wall biosynthesis
MRILIDSTQVPVERTGVGIYADQLIPQIASIVPPQDRLFLLLQSDDAYLHGLVAAHPRVAALTIPSSIFRNRLALGVYEQCVLPFILLAHRIDVVHSLHYTFPLLSPCAQVVTLHDMTHWLHPGLHTRGRTIVMSRFARLAMQHAEAVLFVSDSTRKDAERLFGSGNNLRTVTPLAVDHAAFTDIQPAAIDETLARLGIERPYILFLGTLEPRKNIVRLIHAFDSLGKKFAQYKLVIAGKPGWHYEAILEAVENSPNKARILRLGYVAPEDKAPLIAGCDALVYPSLYEGFGLPVLEGMAAGAPVITGNASSLPEIAGDAALLVDPSSTEQIAAAMRSVLSDETLRARMRIASRRQAAKFSWGQTARTTYAAYRRLDPDPR